MEVSFDSAGRSIPANTKYTKVEEQTLDVGKSVFDIKNYEDIQATGKRKELFDYLIDNNPDSAISDEIEAYIFRSLMLDEEKIKMYDPGEIKEDGVMNHSGCGFRSINYKKTDDGSKTICAWGYRRENDKVTNSWTYLTDKDNDGYADEIYMLSNDGTLPSKETYIDLNSDRKSSGNFAENMFLK